MARRIYEFRCTECGKYFDVKLNTSLNGNYRIHCPNCGHVHYRALVNGEITESRFTDDKNRDSEILIEDIRPMKACCRDFKKEMPEDSVPTLAGFMHRLWQEKFTF